MIVEGKTKRIETGPQPGTVRLVTKDALTAGDAARRQDIAGIAEHKTTQAAHVFNLLNSKGIPTAFIHQENPSTLLCHACDMLPLEIVVRRFAWGSYLKRHPELQAAGSPRRFDIPVVELFHKHALVVSPASDRPVMMDESAAREKFLRDGSWAKGVHTDPYIKLTGQDWALYSAKEPATGHPLLVIEPLLYAKELAYVTNELAVPTFLALEEAWQSVATEHGPVALADMKLEVGRKTTDGSLVVADVIDNDSWRIWPGADPQRQLDKQCFRDGHPLTEVAEKYALVAKLTRTFTH